MPPRVYLSAAIVSPEKAAAPPAKKVPLVSGSPAKIEMKIRTPPPSESKRGTSAAHIPASGEPISR